MPNRAIEFHDSTFDSLERDGANVTLRFSEAYIHESNGEPGIAAGVYERISNGRTACCIPFSRNSPSRNVINEIPRIGFAVALRQVLDRYRNVEVAILKSNLIKVAPAKCSLSSVRMCESA
jgi:hypothetical protein